MDDDQLYPSAPTLYNFPDPPVAFRYPLSRKPGAGAICIARALADIDQTTHIAWSISYSSSRARGFSLYLAMQTQQKPRRGGRPRGFHLDCALAQRLKSLFRRAGDRYRSATRENWPQAGRAALTPGGRAHRAFYWPDGREICHEKPSPRVPSGTRAHPSGTPVTKSVRSPEPTGPLSIPSIR